MTMSNYYYCMFHLHGMTHHSDARVAEDPCRRAQRQLQYRAPLISTFSTSNIHAARTTHDSGDRTRIRWARPSDWTRDSCSTWAGMGNMAAYARARAWRLDAASREAANDRFVPSLLSHLGSSHSHSHLSQLGSNLSTSRLEKDRQPLASAWPSRPPPESRGSALSAAQRVRLIMAH